MSTAIRKARRRLAPADDPLRFVYHPSFEAPDAPRSFAASPEVASAPGGFLPDEATRDCARRMHYAAWRSSTSATRSEAARWRRCYYDWRDRIVLGNRKLTFRAVQKWSPPRPLADDMTSECQIVLIQAVAAYNPWLGVRFSTYAFTCLMRALSRLSQRQAADRFARSVSLTALAGGEPSSEMPEPTAQTVFAELSRYFQSSDDLLTPREKTVLLRRYQLDEAGQGGTLEQVGRELGLSKERVRQVQSSALGKLRAALVGPAYQA